MSDDASASQAALGIVLTRLAELRLTLAPPPSAPPTPAAARQTALHAALRALVSALAGLERTADRCPLELDALLVEHVSGERGGSTHPDALLQERLETAVKARDVDTARRGYAAGLRAALSGDGAPPPAADAPAPPLPPLDWLASLGLGEAVSRVFVDGEPTDVPASHTDVLLQQLLAGTPGALPEAVLEGVFAGVKAAGAAGGASLAAAARRTYHASPRVPPSAATSGLALEAWVDP